MKRHRKQRRASRDKATNPVERRPAPLKKEGPISPAEFKAALPPPDIDPWLLPIDHPDWEPDSSGPGDGWMGTLDDPEHEPETDAVPDWRRLGYPSYRAWWMDHGYMTLPEPEPDSDETED